MSKIPYIGIEFRLSYAATDSRRYFRKKISVLRVRPVAMQKCKLQLTELSRERFSVHKLAVLVGGLFRTSLYEYFCQLKTLLDDHNREKH